MKLFSQMGGKPFKAHLICALCGSAWGGKDLKQAAANWRDGGKPETKYS